MARKVTPEMFWARIDFSGDCWEWIGSVNAQGYEQVKYRQDGKFYDKAHRVAWLLLVGEPPPCLDHLCRHRPCVNPDHLEAVTYRENMLRGASPAAMRRRASHCPAGHAFTPENTRYRRTKYEGTRRDCRTCVRVQALKRYHARQEARLG